MYQFHNPPFVPVPGGEDGLYDAAMKAREEGKIRFIGISQHSIDRAFEAVNSGLYDTLQYPFNHLATDREIELVKLCGEKNVGFVCMKALSGGLVTNARSPFAYLPSSTCAHLGHSAHSRAGGDTGLLRNPPELDEATQKLIEADRRELVGSFCRSCGYCLPCPAGIPIHNANRMRQLLERSPWRNWVTPQWQADMEKIENCIHCGACASAVPTG